MSRRVFAAPMIASASISISISGSTRAGMPSKVDVGRTSPSASSHARV
jgi:hypothetical protein